MKTYRKGVNEAIRRGVDWEDRLIEADSVSTSAWVVDLGIDTDDATMSDTYSDIDISGGTVNTTYRLTNRITTDKGLAYERSFNVLVAER